MGVERLRGVLDLAVDPSGRSIYAERTDVHDTFDRLRPMIRPIRLRALYPRTVTQAKLWSLVLATMLGALLGLIVRATS